MRFLDEYIEARNQLFAYFGVAAGHRVTDAGIVDEREAFWCLGVNEVEYASTEQELKDECGEYYAEDIFDGGVFEGASYTMVWVYDGCGGLPYVIIFGDEKRRKMKPVIPEYVDEDWLPSQLEQIEVNADGMASIKELVCWCKVTQARYIPMAGDFIRETSHGRVIVSAEYKETCEVETVNKDRHVYVFYTIRTEWA